MSGPFLTGDKALERLGEVTGLVCSIADKEGIGPYETKLLEKYLLDMEAALRSHDVEKAKYLVMRLLTEVLGYDSVRAKFVMYNHLNKNAGWD
ncbi:MAG: hypothetical protein KJ002_06825 [Candidatus Dadabacteria bacterium]|jgi:hypothetical protein|nr:hypothetical protein [Candidatus Dadabacteria bacterium]